MIKRKTASVWTTSDGHEFGTRDAATAYERRWLLQQILQPHREKSEAINALLSDPRIYIFMPPTTESKR